jgi:hypothetical protein
LDEAQRLLAVLFRTARAQSSLSGLSVYWRTTPEGFRFDGLPVGSLPDRWLTEGTTVVIRSGQTSANDAVPAWLFSWAPSPSWVRKRWICSVSPLCDGHKPPEAVLVQMGCGSFALVAP